MEATPAGTPLEACPHCGAAHDEATLRCPATDMVLPFTGRLLAGKFRLVRELGRGGMGAVWRARNIHVDREVALKLILPEVSKNPEIMARFHNEARVAAKIGHPGICDILDLESSALGPVIVMELLRGENLGQRLAREGRLPVPVAVKFMREALSALEAAHRVGIIHRDLKPENLFLHQAEVGTTVVKLMDFGISKFTDRTGAPTAHGVIMGTPEYMAPEQVNGAVHADARTDIWAIGTVLYKALTGVDPFAGASVPATLVAIITADPAPLESHVSEIPRSLSAAILRCLAKEPQERFQSAAELSAALQPFEAGAELAPQVSDASLGVLPTVEVGVAHSAILPPIPRNGGGASRWPLVVVATLVLGLVGAGAWQLLAEDVAAAPAAPDSLPAAESVPSALSPLSGPATTGAPEPAPAPEAEPTTTGLAAEPATTTAAAADPVDNATTGAAPVVEAPPELIAVGELVTPAVAGKVGNQRWAKQYCAALAQNSYLNISKWKLANPSEARSFAAAAGLKAGGYWTSATHRGRGLVVWLPRGTDSSVRVATRAGRPLCVAPKPAAP